MKSLPGWLALSLAAILLAACGKNAASTGSSQSDLFPTDPLKSEWQTVTSAIKTNGYVVAVSHLRIMQSGSSTPEQLNAVNETLRAVNSDMYEAAGKGDPNATNALQELLRTGRRR
jgi:hypothetical protein